MTVREYWDDDVCLAKYYRQAHELKRRERNQEMWINGLYVYEAICRASPILRSLSRNGTKPIPYLNEPLSLTINDIREKEESEEKNKYEINKSKFSAWADAINKKKGGKNDGRECD